MKKPITLVILPGLDGTEVLFRPLLALLPDWIQPVVICFPASGPNEYADLLEMVREKIAGLPSFIVLASSFSGPLSIMLAAAEPDRVRGLILSATFLRAPGRHLSSLRLIACRPLIWIMRTARRIPIWTLRRRDDPYRQAKAEIWRRVSARCLAKRTRAILGVDVRELSSKCEVPMLCIRFADDKVVPPEFSEEILCYQPSAQIVTIPGDHFALWKNAARWTEAITRFAQGLRGQSAGERDVSTLTQPQSIQRRADGFIAY